MYILVRFNEGVQLSNYLLHQDTEHSLPSPQKVLLCRFPGNPEPRVPAPEAIPVPDPIALVVSRTFRASLEPLEST